MDHHIEPGAGGAAGFMAFQHEVAVIIPTRALASRRRLLRRALDSVLEQEAVVPLPIVVVNGNEADRETLSELRRCRRVKLVQQVEADLPSALQAGHATVETPWFGTLDDDDFLLPGALQARCRVLAEVGELDAIVTNGYRSSGGNLVLNIGDMEAIARDPLRALTDFNWLLPGSWTCATNAATSQLFQGMPRYRECTFLAIQLALHLRVHFLHVPTVVWHTDTPDSESKSAGYRIGQADATRQLLRLDTPAPLRASLRRSLSSAHHHAATAALALGDRREAWRQHLRSLAGHRAWRYLPFTLRLLMPRSMTGLDRCDEKT